MEISFQARAWLDENNETRSEWKVELGECTLNLLGLLLIALHRIEDDIMEAVYDAPSEIEVKG